MSFSLAIKLEKIFIYFSGLPCQCTNSFSFILLLRYVDDSIILRPEDLSHRLSSLGIDARDVAAAAGDPLTGRRGYFLSSAPNLFFQHANVKERLVNNRISLNEVGKCLLLISLI